MVNLLDLLEESMYPPNSTSSHCLHRPLFKMGHQFYAMYVGEIYIFDTLVQWE
jgi:hypothetical protein